MSQKSPYLVLSSRSGDDPEQFTEHPQEQSQCSSPETYEDHKKIPSKKIKGKRIQGMHHLGSDTGPPTSPFSDVERALPDVQYEESTCETAAQDSAVQRRETRRHDLEEDSDSPSSLSVEKSAKICCETDVAKEEAENYEDGSIPSRQYFCMKILNECVRLLCPCVVLVRALCRCDLGLFWKLCSSIFVLKAFWSSTVCLGVCTLFKVHRVIPALDPDIGSNITEAYLFGLWTYTGKILEEDHSLEGFVEGEIERIETCRFHMQRIDEEDAPDGLFLNDAAFTVARVFAVIAVVVGCISMVSVWLTAANVLQRCCHGRRRWLLPSALAMCSIMESFVLLILSSSVCRDTKYDEHRQCTLQADSGMIFASIVSYLISAVATAKVANIPQSHLDGYSNDSNSLAIPSGFPDDAKLDSTFDESDDSSSDGEGPSRFEIS